MDTALKCYTVTAITLGTIILIKKYLHRKKYRSRRVWSKVWLQQRDNGKGVLAMLNNEIKLEDPIAYHNFLRMDNTNFEHLLTLISPVITKQDTVMRQSITARNKLQVTLRYLASGETFRSLMYATRIHESTISRFVPEVCKAIIQALQQDVLKVPSTAEDWLSVAQEFNNLWQYPHCLGALDGRHITFRPPISDGAYYYNYKGTNSIVLLGLVDAKYKFLYVNVGVNGRISDGGVYNQSSLSEAIRCNTLNFPSPSPLPGQNSNVPYVIIADDAFPLSTNIMKPYPERGLSYECRVFNYRLSRARRTVENAFGILANRFRILLNPINLSATKVELLTLTCVILHNFLITTKTSSYLELTDKDEQLPKLLRCSSNRSTKTSREIRDYFKEFFNSPEGHIPWQDNLINNYNY